LKLRKKKVLKYSTWNYEYTNRERRTTCNHQRSNLQGSSGKQ
jgi:hypothetical protein